MITGKVTDSVQQMKVRCDNLIQDGRELSELDITIACETLQRVVGELVSAYDNNPSDYLNLQTRKITVDAKALILERLIYHRTGKYAEVIKTREFVKTLHRNVVERIKEITEMDTPNNDTLVRWTTFLPFVLKLSVCASQTCFELDEDDKQEIEKITKEMTLYNELKGGTNG